MSVKEFAERYITAQNDAWKHGNFETLEKIESPDIQVHTPPVAEHNGFKEHMQQIIKMRGITKDFHQDWGYVTGDGTVAVLSLKETFTLTTDLPEFKVPAGTMVNLDAYFVLKTEDERVVELWEKGSLTLK